MESLFSQLRIASVGVVCGAGAMILIITVLKAF